MCARLIVCDNVNLIFHNLSQHPHVLTYGTGILGIST